MAAFQKLFMLSLYALLVTSFESNETEDYFESIGNKTYPHGNRNKEALYDPTTHATTKITFSNTSHTSQSKGSVDEQNVIVKNDQTLKTTNFETKNNKDGIINSAKLSSRQKPSDQNITLSENSEEVTISNFEISPSTLLPVPENEPNYRIVRQAENKSIVKLQSNDTNSDPISSEVMKPGNIVNTPTTTTPILKTSELTTKSINGSTSATKTVKRFWNFITFGNLIAVVGVVGLLGWAYYILHGVH